MRERLLEFLEFSYGNICRLTLERLLEKTVSYKDNVSGCDTRRKGPLGRVIAVSLIQFVSLQVVSFFTICDERAWESRRASVLPKRCDATRKLASYVSVELCPFILYANMVKEVKESRGHC